MDIVEVLVLLLFVVFPLLQHVLSRRRQEPELGMEEDDLDLEELMAERAPEQGPPAPAPPGEERGWEYLPEAPRIESVVDEERALELLSMQAELDPEHAPEALRVSAPVVSLESLTVDREAEHTRMRAGRANAAAVARRPRRATRLTGLLDSSQDLRRGIVLSEILGPPRGLE